MINRMIKKIQRFDLIENGKVEHLFKITHLDNSTAVYNNSGEIVMKSKIIIINNKEEKTNETFDKGD